MRAVFETRHIIFEKSGNCPLNKALLVFVFFTNKPSGRYNWGMETIANPLHFTAADFDAMEPKDIHQLALQASGCVLKGRLLMGRCLLSMQRTQAFRIYGASSVIHYAINYLGCRADEAYDVRRMAELLESLPLLTEAAEAGEVGWSHLRAVLRRATPENEADWLELAQTCSMKRLEWLLRNDGSPEAEREADLTTLEFRILPLVAQMFQRATRIVCQSEKRRVAAAEIFEYVLAEFLAAYDGSEPEEAIEEARRDLDTPWEAAEVREEPCPSHPDVTLVSLPEWAKRVAFNAQARHVTEAQKTLLLRRDRYRCSTPGCPNNLWLQMHHIVFYCDGGATVPENLTTVCAACHANIHQGHLAVTGMPPGLTWTTQGGRELGVPELGEPAEWADVWLRSG